EIGQDHAPAPQGVGAGTAHRRPVDPGRRGHMTIDEAKAVIFRVLADIAPEVDPATVDHTLDLTEQIDLDSMDYLAWLLASARRPVSRSPSGTWPASSPSTTPP